MTQAYNVEKELPPTSLQLSTLIERPWFRWSNIPKQTLVHHGALYICPLEQKLRGRRKRPCNKAKASNSICLQRQTEEKKRTMLTHGRWVGGIQPR